MKNNKEPDFIDFLFDNADTFKDGFLESGKYARDVWDILPEVFYKIFVVICDIFQKITLKLRTYFALKLNEDMKHLDNDKKLWEYLITSYAQRKLSKKVKKLKVITTDTREKDYLDLIYYYVKKDQKERFLECCIIQQHNEKFVKILNMFNTPSIPYNDDVTDTDATNNDQDTISETNEIYSQDIFTTEKHKANKNSTKNINRQSSDARVISVVDSYKKNNK